VTKLLSLLDRAVQALTALATGVAGLFILLTALIVTYEVVMRALFQRPHRMGNRNIRIPHHRRRLSRLAVTFAEDKHIKVDLLTIKLPAKINKYLEIGVNLIALAFSLVCLIESWEMAALSLAIDRTAASSIRMPLWIPQSACPSASASSSCKSSAKSCETSATSPPAGSPPALLRAGWRADMTIFIILLMGLLLCGLPVAFSLGAAGLAGMLFFAGGPAAFTQIPIIAYKSLDDFVLTAVPLYVLMSQILLTGKVGSDLYEVATKWLRHLPGGLGVATILACAIFAAISGSSVATAVTIGAVAIPEMLSRGYDRRLVIGSVAAGGTLGILIPPSIPMILYGSITGESVGELFMSGAVPGLILTSSSSPSSFSAPATCRAKQLPPGPNASPSSAAPPSASSCPSSSSAASTPASSPPPKQPPSAPSTASSSPSSATAPSAWATCPSSSKKPSKPPP
jgi:TRAP-type C4-dicarboxylate transport system permease small subunit